MRIVLRDNLTNELIVVLFDHVEDDMNDNEINDLLMNDPCPDDETEELLNNENYYISYEEDGD